jgi:hypothetical protein
LEPAWVTTRSSCFSRSPRPLEVGGLLVMEGGREKVIYCARSKREASHGKPNWESQIGRQNPFIAVLAVSVRFPVAGWGRLRRHLGDRSCCAAAGSQRPPVWARPRIPRVGVSHERSQADARMNRGWK